MLIAHHDMMNASAWLFYNSTVIFSEDNVKKTVYHMLFGEEMGRIMEKIRR